MMRRILGVALKVVAALVAAFFVLAFVIDYGRRAKERASQDVARETPMSAPASGASSYPSRSGNPYAASVASFRGSELDECADFELSPSTGNEAAATAAIESLTSEKPDKDGGGTRKNVRLNKWCAEQFDGRPVLATCALDTDVKLGHWKTVSRYYAYSTVGKDDSYMQDCLGMRGDWKAADADTLDRARIHRQMRQLEELAKSAN